MRRRLRILPMIRRKGLIPFALQTAAPIQPVMAAVAGSRAAFFVSAAVLIVCEEEFMLSFGAAADVPPVSGVAGKVFSGIAKAISDV